MKLKNSSRDTRIRVDNTFSGELFRKKIPFRVDTIEVDPEYQLITGGNTVNAVNEHGMQPVIGISPNPAKDHVTFSFGQLLAGNGGRLEIYNASGQLADERSLLPGLSEYVIDGIKTTIPFHLQLMKNEQFKAGDFNTKFLESFEMK